MGNKLVFWVLVATFVAGTLVLPQAAEARPAVNCKVRNGNHAIVCWNDTKQPIRLRVYLHVGPCDAATFDQLWWEIYHPRIRPGRTWRHTTDYPLCFYRSTWWS